MFPNQERVPKAANQAPASVILQNYKERYLTQRKEELNQTGLPDDLKTGMENLSGYSLDDVRVHYNSDKPVQLNALAYAQGTDIHIASGQEQHLPHEAWHVVQQKQGRVHPTMQLQEINVNDNEELEKEADMMGGKAVQFKKTSSAKNDTILQRLKIKLGETEYPNAEPISDRQDRSYKVEGPFVIKIFKSGKADNEFKVMESIKGNENVVNVIKKDIAFFSDY
ncbi:MAG: DUF4157 domain-containing protein, partial [Tannerellaceae bacterium]|nr:DUF4157 domain-containing protein [Tannerellaceae bacterium]